MKLTKKSGAAASSGKDLAWHEAVQQVLAAADGALGCAEIAERIIDRGLRRSVGATPAQTIAATLSLALRDENSPFVKVARGIYTLKAKSNSPDTSSLQGGREATDSAQTGALRAFGMFWRRDAVVWSGAPRLIGRQGSGASDVNFAGQIGVYLLHDRDRAIYVGRASDTLCARLKAHTVDRLSGRWDRFSWFGLRGVSDAGSLIEEKCSLDT